MDKRISAFRFFAAVFFSLCLLLFINSYSQFKAYCFVFETYGRPLGYNAYYLVHYGWIAYIVVVAVLVSGFIVMKVKRDYTFVLEVLATTTWMVTLLWCAICLLIWQSQYAFTISNSR